VCDDLLLLLLIITQLSLLVMVTLLRRDEILASPHSTLQSVKNAPVSWQVCLFTSNYAAHIHGDSPFVRA
jgi:hypothetical protein